MPIELNKPRVIVLQDRSKQYKLTVGRIARQQWLKYFEGIVSVSENQNGKRVDSFDSSAARLELAEGALIGAEGYKTAKHVTETSGWQKLLPLSHRLGVANALIGVGPSTAEDEEEIALGQETVYLDAVWGADDTGVMLKHRALRHTFQTPSSEHQRRYSRDSSRSVIVGGSRTGKTRWLGARGTLVDLYDELILEVDGYTVDSEGNLEQHAIVEYMDTYHKATAADQLFSAAAPNVNDEEK